MWGSPGVAGHRVISVGTVLVVGGGLALYQLTSLVLGPGGSRQLHLSLTIPAADTAERTEPWTSSGNLVLGTLVAPTPNPLPVARSTAAHRASTMAASHPAPKPPVASPVPHPSEPPAPIVRGGPAPQPGGDKPDDSD